MDAAALRYLEACSRASARMPDAQTPDALVRTGKALLDTGCSDPMVAYNYGINLYKIDRFTDAKPYLLLAIDGFKSCRYPRARTRAAASRLVQMDHDELLLPMHDPTAILRREQAAMGALSLQWLGESLLDGSYSNTEQRLFFDQMDNEINDTFSLRQVVDKVHTISDVDPYILNVLDGREERDLAWDAQHHGTVAVFKQHMASARQKFTTAWQLHPDYPEAPCDMISLMMVGNANPDESVFTWFNRAVAAQMDYGPAYDFLFASQRPLWGGSMEEVYRAGVACLQTRRFDTAVPGYFLRAMHLIRHETSDGLRCWHSPETYQHMQTLFDGYLQTDMSPQQRNSLNSRYAAVAYLCGHYADAQHLLDALGRQVDEEPFQFYARCSLDTARDRIKQGLYQAAHQPPAGRRFVRPKAGDPVPLQ